MNKMTNLLKDHRVGLWCKRMAWIVLAFGILQIVFQIYYQSQIRIPVEPALLLSTAVGILATYGFYFFILYAAGTVIDLVVRSLQEKQQIPPEPSYPAQYPLYQMKQQQPQYPPYQPNPQQPYNPPRASDEGRVYK
jgi:hypothetical protein